MFLHANTELPAGAPDANRRGLANGRCVGGCFRLQFDSRRPLLRLFAWFSRLETAATSFGDQAFFIRRAAFVAVGGCLQGLRLEDVELRRRRNRRGSFVKLREQVTTSARRFEAKARFAARAIILGLCAWGAPHGRLAR